MTTTYPATPLCHPTTLVGPLPPAASPTVFTFHVGSVVGFLLAIGVYAHPGLVPIAMLLGGGIAVYSFTLLRATKHSKEVWVTYSAAELQNTYYKLRETKLASGVRAEALDPSTTAVERVIQKLAMPRDDWSLSKDRSLQEQAEKELAVQIQRVEALREPCRTQ